MKMRVIGLLYLLLTCTAYAQISLSEVGVSLGGGASLGLGTSSYRSAPDGVLTGFYTHFACGKPYGYHIETNLRYAQGTQTNADASLPNQNKGFFFIEAGLYGKLRARKYNQKKEAFMLFGPKMAVGAGTMQENAYAVPTQTALGVHTSVNQRFTLASGSSIFVSAVGEYYPTGVIAPNAGGLLALQLRVAYVFWKSI